MKVQMMAVKVDDVPVSVKLNFIMNLAIIIIRLNEEKDIKRSTESLIQALKKCPH